MPCTSKKIYEKADEREEKLCFKTLDLIKSFVSDPDSVNLDMQHQCFGSGSRLIQIRRKKFNF
jgi:hypothetical protein